MGFLFAVPAAGAPPQQSDFVRWAHAAPGRLKEVQAFEAYLRRQGVAGILPLSQVLLNASSWQACGVAPYSLAPRALWPHVVPTLRFIRARIVPALGPVAALSGYREPALNKCSGGAPKSAHAQYYALDLTPLRFKDREKMIAAVCRLHARFGAKAHVGLGFYQGMRFHIDTNGFRRWGSDYHSATSPCIALEEGRWRKFGMN
ncbi:MAG TPA: D-Ala-D-Ala carboxypeptidase family metallohydrolase [Rhizomicrobium sp.]